MTTALAAPPDHDHRVFLHGVSWKQFETILAIRGDRSGVRIAYLEGELELMSPSRRHECVKKAIARLLEAYTDELGMDFNGYGSWTLRERPKEAAAEPDECYVLSADPDPDRPDLAIEVVYTSGGIDKLEIYRRLRVREVWYWEEGKITPYSLGKKDYAPAPRSRLLPALDLALIARLAERPNQREAVRELRDHLRGEARRR